MTGGAVGIFCVLGGLTGLIMGLPSPQFYFPSQAFQPAVLADPKAIVDLSSSSMSGFTGMDQEVFHDQFCRQGFSGIPGDEHSRTIVDCQNELKPNAVNGTKECINVCIWRKLNFVNPLTGNVDRSRLELVINGLYQGSVGAESAKSYVEDFLECFTKSKPSVNFDNSGCRRNQPFSKCFKEKTNKACPSTAAANADAQTSDSGNTGNAAQEGMPVTSIRPAMGETTAIPPSQTKPAGVPVTSAPATPGSPATLARPREPSTSAATSVGVPVIAMASVATTVKPQYLSTTYKPTKV